MKKLYFWTSIGMSAIGMGFFISAWITANPTYTKVGYVMLGLQWVFIALMYYSKD